jgi:Protein of unknown function (DUF3750)
MTSQECEKLIDKNKYQVFICTSFCSFPFNFALHPWFVINKKGVISRWDVIDWKNINDTSCKHLHKNFLPPWKGLWMVRYVVKISHKASLFSIIEGDENSIARKMADFIENSPKIYPYCNKYHFVGPNSNTYVQWILNQFPELKIKLPWNCFGKNFQK